MNHETMSLPEATFSKNKFKNVASRSDIVNHEPMSLPEATFLKTNLKMSLLEATF